MMDYMATPTYDGQAVKFSAVPNLPSTPLIYYVNGIRTSGAQHKETAVLLSGISERTVIGIYNQTEGAIKDFVQCLNDWLLVVEKQIIEIPFNVVDELVKGMRRLVGIQRKPATAGDVFRKAIPG